jgi:nicotinamidase-related amidase
MKLGPTLEPIVAELKGVKAIEKNTFDCLACQPIREELSRLGRGVLLLAGVEAHICVAQTALNSVSSYRVQVVGDAAGSRVPANRDLAWERLRKAGVTITSTEMLIYELLGQAGTLEFKATLPLVK